MQYRELLARELLAESAKSPMKSGSGNSNFFKNLQRNLFKGDGRR